MLIVSGRSLSEFSTFGIGGPIRYLCEIRTVEEAKEALRFASSENLPFLVIGKGSNCLFRDQGFDGLAILNKIDGIAFRENEVEAGGGASFSLLGVQTARKGFSGLEFASGIPASVGGAVYMNAGANGQETCEALQSVLFLDERGGERRFERSELQFSYRHSPFQSMRGIIASAVFALTPNPKAREAQLKIIDYRMKTQPYKDKSAGCVFRNPGEGKSAGALIDKCGLKGVAVGGAKVSERHANFIVNSSAAASADVLALMERVQKEVFEKTGVHLEPEIRVLP